MGQRRYLFSFRNLVGQRGWDSAYGTALLTNNLSIPFLIVVVVIWGTWIFVKIGCEKNYRWVVLDP